MTGEPVVRESIILTQDSAFIRHAAIGDRTLCGVELGGSIPDPPSLAGEGATTCHTRACREALR